MRERSGRKSERYDPSQLALFPSEPEEAGDVAEPPEADDLEPPPRLPRGRRRLDANARREQKFHRLREHQKICPNAVR